MYSKISRTLLIATSLIFLSGCDWGGVKEPPIPPDVVTVVKWSVPDCDMPPVVTPVSFLPVAWGVVDDAGNTLFTLTPAMYENLSKNTADILGSLREKNSVIDYYEQCLENARKLN